MFGFDLAAAGSLLSGISGFFGNRQRTNTGAYRLAREQFEWQKNRIQNTVADAKAAGVHPLFALGGSGGFSPVSVSGGESRGGLGRGLASLGQALSGKRAKTAQEQAAAAAGLSQIQSQTRRNDAEASYYDALAAKTRQDPVAISNARDVASLSFGGLTPSRSSSSRSSSARVTARPGHNRKPKPGKFLGPHAGATLQKRGRGYSPDEPVPLYIWVETPEGLRRAYNPELGLDEVGQAHWVGEPLKEAGEASWRSWWNQFKRDLRRSPGRFPRGQPSQRQRRYGPR